MQIKISWMSHYNLFSKILWRYSGTPKDDIRPKNVTHVTKICHTARAARRKHCQKRNFVIFLSTLFFGYFCQFRHFCDISHFCETCHKNDISHFCDICHKNDISHFCDMSQKRHKSRLWHMSHSCLRSARILFFTCVTFVTFFDMSQKRHKHIPE